VGFRSLFGGAVLALGLVAAVGAHAATYVADYTATDGSGANAQLTITTSNTLDAAGGYDILSVSGLVDGQTVTGLIPNGSPPNPVTSPSGAFIYDNVLFPGSDPVLDVYGVLYSSTGEPEWNLWGVSPGSYNLYSFNGSSFDVASNGVLSLTFVPEPATWAFLILGVAMIGFAARRRRDEAVLGAA
jgi:hypothetical protein